MPTPQPYTAKDGTTTWRVRFRHRGRHTSETFPTRRAAQSFCHDLAAHGPDHAVTMLEHADELAGSPTLDQVAQDYLAARARRVRSDRTIADYARDYRLWIQPTLGHRPIITITDVDVAHLVEQWVAQLAPKTVHDRHALLHGIIKHAMSPAGGKHLTTDPCAHTDLPRKRRTPPKALRPAEWVALHRALAVIDHDAADLAELLLLTGLRWSEATALDGWAVDDHDSHVTLTIGRVVRRNAAGQHVIVDDTKADASARTITLSPRAAELIRARMPRAGLLFTTRTGAQWHYSNFTGRAWRRAVEAAQLERRPTVHWLRHTHVVWSLHAGAGLSEIQARVGHASITTTIGTYGRGVVDVSASVLTGLDSIARADRSDVRVIER